MKNNIIKTLFTFLTGAILLNSCKTGYEVVRSETVQYSFSETSNVVIDSSLFKQIQPFREKLIEEMSEVISVTDSVLEKKLPEGKLGNLVSDACMKIAREKNFTPDFAVFNHGGLRKSLSAGSITRGDIFEVMPFENELVILTMRGSDVNKLFNFIAYNSGAPVSGVRMRISNKLPYDIKINGLMVDSLKQYQVLTSDYLANGGDNFSFFVDQQRKNVNVKVRDAIIEYLISEQKSQRMIRTKIEGRIIHE